MADQFPTVMTLEDHIRAAVADDPANRQTHLREAEALAVDGFSMRALLRELIRNDLGDEALRRRIANQVLTMATAERDVSGIRDAAGFEYLQRGDAETAFSILDRAIDLFATPVDQHGLAEFGLGGPEPAPGYVFVLLAQEFAKLPEGSSGVRRALTVGRDAHAAGTDPDNLEDIANGWIEFLDEDEGAALRTQAQVRKASAEPVAVPDRPDFPAPHPPGQPFPLLRSTFGPEPSSSALLDLARSNISAAGLETIAKADYGLDFSDHLAAVTAIVDTGLVSTPTHWVPGEVLALYRWHTGGETDHLARAFCCTVLTLDASLMYPSAFSITTAPYLTESCLVLGGDYVPAAQQLLAWRYCAVPESDSDGLADRQASVLGALLLAVLSGSGVPDWAQDQLDLSPLNEALSGDRATGQASTLVWRHLLGLALPRVPDGAVSRRAIASALGAVTGS